MSELMTRDMAMPPETFARIDGHRIEIPGEAGGGSWEIYAETHQVTLHCRRVPVVRAGDPIEDHGVIIGHALADAGAGDAVVVSLLPIEERPLAPVPSPVALAWAAKVF